MQDSGISNNKEHENEKASMDSLCETNTKIIQNTILFICWRIQAKRERINFLTLCRAKKVSLLQKLLNIKTYFSSCGLLNFNKANSRHGANSNWTVPYVLLYKKTPSLQKVPRFKGTQFFLLQGGTPCDPPNCLKWILFLSNFVEKNQPLKIDFFRLGILL